MEAISDKPLNAKNLQNARALLRNPQCGPYIVIMELLRLISVAVFAALAAPLWAQDIAAAEDTGVVAAEQALGIADRWRADPGAVFDGADINLDDLRYVARPIIVLSTSPDDPLVIEQLSLLQSRIGELIARDVILILDTDTEAPSAIRAQFRPRGFSMLLLDKDGTIVLRKPVPWNVREIVHTIDRLPSRQRELRGN